MVGPIITSDDYSSELESTKVTLPTLYIPEGVTWNESYFGVHHRHRLEINGNQVYRILRKEPGVLLVWLKGRNPILVLLVNKFLLISDAI